MKFWRKLFGKNWWISTGIIILSVMLFKGLVGDLLTKWIGLGEGIILDFLSLLVIVLLSRLISEEILEL